MTYRKVILSSKEPAKTYSILTSRYYVKMTFSTAERTVWICLVREIMDKMASLKSVIERNSSNLIKRLNKPKEEVEKEKKIKKDNKKKGKNSKIPLESTSIMQKWLL